MSNEIDNSAYPTAYGTWAGNPRGIAPDYARCCESVSDRHHSKQCSKPRGHGPGAAYCAVHNPERKAAKEAERLAQFRAESARRGADRIESERLAKFSADAIAAIRLIAAGHDNPRKMAIQVLNNAGETK